MKHLELGRTCTGTLKLKVQHGFDSCPHYVTLDSHPEPIEVYIGLNLGRLGHITS